jgi:putative nucleotidyltransferase with HDIG domain
MVDVRNDDVDRIADGEQPVFGFVEDEALTLARDLLDDGIRSTELEAVRADLVTNPRSLILLRDLPVDQRAAVEAAVADLVAVSLQANEVKDEAATEAARQAAAEAVPDVTVVFLPGEVIVRAGDVVDPVELQAILELGLLEPEEGGPSLRALVAIATLMVLLGVFFLWRIGAEFWRHPKMVALFGLLVVLAALAARVPELVARDRVELGFLLPAALFGYLGASLFDSRVAVLLAVPVTAFTGLATGDLALAVYAAGAALAPIPLVSAVSSRAQLNAAVVLSAAIHAPLAAAIAWYFYGSDAVALSAVVGAASGLIAGVAALGVLPFLASVFGITTAQTLLDLTDRNHPALRRIEEEAPGTFNHSIMVGNLAGRAARAIGADVLLAQAMAYYHDLGKTTAPQYFVENQFGVSNPHDLLPPEESARLIRSHVSEGLRLAREFRIPPDVAQGIYTHHGTSLMRFFYHKALDLYGDDVNPADYRHRGRKPQSKEMVIVMFGDACEAATRALVQHEDPTSESLRTLVEQVITEKVEDGQLEESNVTFGELTRIKEALVDALIGYYHTRIPYPGFPGTPGAVRA